MGQCSVVQPYLRDQDVLRLDVPVETVVEVTEVDGLQCLPDDALHSRRVQMSASREQRLQTTLQFLGSHAAADLRLAASQQIYNLD